MKLLFYVVAILKEVLSHFQSDFYVICWSVTYNYCRSVVIGRSFQVLL